MTANDVEEHLVSTGLSAMVAGRIRELVRAFGSCDEFAKATPGEIAAKYNAAHPDSGKGLGKSTYEAIDRAKCHIRGNSDAAKLEAKAKAERAEADANAEARLKEDFLRGFDSEPFEVETLKSVVTMVELTKQTTVTIGDLKYLYSMMKRGGAR